MTATPLFTQVVGSHIWGHDTPDSDIDLIAVYADDPDEILSGIGPTKTRPQLFDPDGEIMKDVQSIEIGHLINLLIKTNPNAIFAVMSPEQVYMDCRFFGAYWRLRNIVETTMSKAIYPAIIGMAQGYLKAALNAETAVERDKCYLGRRRVIGFGERYLDGVIAFGPTDMTTGDPFAVFHAARDRSTLPERSPPEPYRKWLLALRRRMQVEAPV